MSPQRHETRSGTIGRHVNRAVQAGVLTWEGLADKVRKHYETMVPPQVRGVKFQDPESSAQPSKALGANEKKVYRWFEILSTTTLPAEAEESVVFSLPEPYHTECLRDLTARYQLHFTPRYEQGSAGTYKGLSHLTEKFADVQRALADGRVDREDIPHLEQLVESAHAAICRGKNNIRSIG